VSISSSQQYHYNVQLSRQTICGLHFMERGYSTGWL